MGLGLRNEDIPGTDFWNLNNMLPYRVQTPCLLITQNSLLPLDKSTTGLNLVTILGGFVAALIFAIISARLMGFAVPQATSGRQGSVRHSTFIGLAPAENLFGPAG